VVDGSVGVCGAAALFIGVSIVEFARFTSQSISA
jgi:hypothetical protein